MKSPTIPIIRKIVPNRINKYRTIVDIAFTDFPELLLAYPISTFSMTLMPNILLPSKCFYGKIGAIVQDKMGGFAMDVRSLLFGMAIGILLTLISIVIIIYYSNRQFIKHCAKAEIIAEPIVQQIIKEKQKEMLLSLRLGFMNNLLRIQELTKELVHEIAVYYYPESRYPELEISIYEALELNRLITERLQSILQHKITTPLKHLRIAQILMILDIKKNIENHPAYQFSKKYKLEKVLKYGYTAFNLTNPFYWIRKVIFHSTIESTLRGFGTLVLHVVGEETSRLYAHRLIQSPDPTELEVDQLLETINRFEIDEA